MAEFDTAGADARRDAGNHAERAAGLGRPEIGLTAAKHLVIPAADAATIRRVAGVVHALASEMDVLSRHQDLSLRLMALVIQDAVSSANAEIRRITDSANQR